LAKPNHELLWTASEAAVGAWGAVSAEEGVPRKYKMTYFDIQGPAEPGRLALTIGGIPFEDERVNREQMTAMKEAGELPCGQVRGSRCHQGLNDHGLKSTHTCGDASPSCDDDDDDDDDDECRAQPQVPVLEVDGMKLSQSQAIATYCGKLTGLYPADPWAAAKCDEVTQLVNQDIRERCISPTMRESDAGKKAELRKELAEIKLPAKFTILEALLSPSGYFVGDSITMADLHVYVLLNWLGMEVLDGVPKEVVLAFPGLTRLVQTLNEHPTIKAWNAGKNSKLPWLE
jgi:glutathione S-transferase